MEETKIEILKQATILFAGEGYEGLSMRILARKVRVAPSVLYYYFKDKDALLKSMFDFINTNLGIERSKLAQSKSTSDMLKQRIEFQLDHAEEIVAVLKFYLTYRKKFKKLPTGFVPDKAYLHIEEVLTYGIEKKEIEPTDIQEQSKVMTHAINGFLLEYYPSIPTNDEKHQLIHVIHKFLWRAIKK